MDKYVLIGPFKISSVDCNKLTVKIPEPTIYYVVVPGPLELDLENVVAIFAQPKDGSKEEITEILIEDKLSWVMRYKQGNKWKNANIYTRDDVIFYFAVKLQKEYLLYVARLPPNVSKIQRVDIERFYCNACTYTWKDRGVDIAEVMQGDKCSGEELTIYWGEVDEVDKGIEECNSVQLKYRDVVAFWYPFYNFGRGWLYGVFRVYDVKTRKYVKMLRPLTSEEVDKYIEAAIEKIKSKYGYVVALSLVEQLRKENSLSAEKLAVAYINALL